jgi:AcrR family transcriptional regulator
MPKSYTEKERNVIITELKRVALESMLQRGIKKTTVDDLVNKVHIPKGTFYLFYDSKELLLFDAIMQKEEEIHKDLIDRLKEIKDDLSVNTLTELLNDIFQIGFNIGILPLMISGELDVLIRKLPDEVVTAHISKDDEFLGIFNQIFPSIKEETLKDYSAALRALFFTAAYKREIGNNFDNALKLLIRGLVQQMWEVQYD